MVTRFIKGFALLGGFLILVGCGGPIQVGQPAGDDDDDNATPTPTQTGNEAFSISVSDPTVDLWIGDVGEVPITIAPVDGYTGTVSLDTKSTVSDLSVAYEDMNGNPITEVTLDGTNSVDVYAVFDSQLTENGQDLTVPAPYTGTYSLTFTDGTLSEDVDIDAKVGPIWVYTLLDVNTAIGAGNQDPWFPHEGSLTIPVGVAPIFVHNGAEPHAIHVNGGGTGWNHMNIGTGESSFMGGLGWNPVSNSFPDITDPVDLADVEANGLIPAGAAGNSGSFYCHSGNGELHGSIDSGNTIAINVP